MSNQIATSFPDTTYTSSSKPSVVTLQADILTIETNHNALDTYVTALAASVSNVNNTSDATKNAAVATLTNKTLTSPVINTPTFSAGAISTAAIAGGAVGIGQTTNIMGTDVNQLQLRYGTAVGTTNASGILVINLNSAFPTQTLSVVCSNGDAGVGNVVINGYLTGYPTSSQFAILARTANTGAAYVGSVRVNYIAIGN